MTTIVVYKFFFTAEEMIAPHRLWLQGLHPFLVGESVGCCDPRGFYYEFVGASCELPAEVLSIAWLSEGYEESYIAEAISDILDEPCTFTRKKLY